MIKKQTYIQPPVADINCVLTFWEAALEAVLARQQFVAACRFGYFLRRSQQRLRLERIMSLGRAKGFWNYQVWSKTSG